MNGLLRAQLECRHRIDYCEGAIAFFEGRMAIWWVAGGANNGRRAWRCAQSEHWRKGYSDMVVVQELSGAKPRPAITHQRAGGRRASAPVPAPKLRKDSPRSGPHPKHPEVPGLVQAFLAGRKLPTAFAEILRHLREEGIEINYNNLKRVLARSPALTRGGKRGWLLAAPRP